MKTTIRKTTSNRKSTMTKHQLETLSFVGLGKLRDSTETEIAEVAALLARNGNAADYRPMLARLTRLLVRVNKAIAKHPTSESVADAMETVRGIRADREVGLL